ncbi:lamin tail domain-containing protein [Streptomyces platensis]|uniref:lamin tail domain-containing protein n=1 Tax=Streptomyces platensis TaxID=58346 RepID=UPI002E1019C0|nr:lamin tail domain-containing protein [Streptomyces platensis]WTI56654.1 lamin tail domain-containing protein [Streptomyces platensis]WUB77856.1 lamin tail domain-containing protein [Streptomyces platensis]
MSRNASRIAAAVLGSAALAATAVLPAAAAGHGHHAPAPHHHYRSAVSLGAIQYDSPGRDDRSNRSLNAEYVTVKNNGHRPVNLRGWTLSDRSGQTYRFGNVRLKGHSQVRVHTGIGRDNRWDLYQDRRTYVWDDSDTAILRNDHHRIVDIESWGRHSGHHHGHWGHSH